MRDTIDGWIADAVFGEFKCGLLRASESSSSSKTMSSSSDLLQHAVPTAKGKKFGMVLFIHPLTHSSKWPNSNVSNRSINLLAP